MNRPAALRRRPGGFTLIELLVVIVILALLVGLLIPAINGAVKSARGAAVQAEINQLAQALADFRGKNGDYPPSRFMVNENGYLNTSDSTVVASGANADVTYGQIANRSIAAIRKFWPQAVVSATGPVASATLFHDFNGNGTPEFNPLATGRGWVLEGHECLVFFLGGVPLRDGTGNVIGVSGFGKAPKYPFSNNNPGASAMYNGNRTPPLFDFAADRLYVNPGAASAGALFSGMPGYVDSLKSSTNVPPQNIYAYFSTNMGAGYDPNDVNFIGSPTVAGPQAETDTLGTASVSLGFTANQPTYSGSSQVTSTVSPSPNPYTTSSTGGTAVAYINAQSFQIISAGVDGYFGLGGMYVPNKETPLPREDANAAAPPNGFPFSPSIDASVRNLEFDNLTNFHNGKLQ